MLGIAARTGDANASRLAVGKYRYLGDIILVGNLAFAPIGTTSLVQPEKL
jgi:hypothetical protein